MKKLLALVLALVMSMSLVTISNAAFKDADKIDYDEAVTVMNAVGVLVGDENSNFNAKENLTRAQAAKIISYLLLGNKTAEALVGAAKFTDVAATRWSAGFVDYCASTGVVAGNGDGTFAPAGQLTGFQFAKMLLVALGYDAKIEGFTGTDWQINVSKVANQVGLFNGLSISGTAVLTREQAAQMCLNTLKAPLVQYSNKGGNISVNGAVIEIGASKAQYVTTTLAREQRINNRTLTNTDTTLNGGYTVEFGEKYYDKLQLKNNEADDFGRPAHTWLYDNEKVGTYAEAVDFEYTAAVTGKELYNAIGKTAVDDYDFSVFVDGNDATKAVTAQIYKNNKANVDETGKGTLTQVFINNDKETVIIAIINTYLAIADGDYNSKKDNVNFDIYGLTLSDKLYVKGVGSERLPASGEDFDVAGVKDEDAYLVTVANKEIQSLVEAKVLSDVTITSFKVKANLTVDGTKYDFGATAYYDAKALKDWNNYSGAANLKDIEYNVYLDTYGYVIGVDEVKAAKNYVFITGVDANSSNLSTKTYDANAIFLDGTSKVIEVKNTSAFQTSINETTNALINSWYAYSVNKDDVYTLTAISADNFPAAEDDEVSGVAQNHVTFNKNKTIDKKNVSLTANDKEVKVAYGNSSTVYLSADLDTVNTTVGAKKVTYGVISGVDGVTTGIKNTSITALSKDNAMKAYDDSEVKAPNFAEGAYLLYKDNGYIIAAVVVGESSESSKNLVYAHTSDLELEGYNTTDAEYTWNRKVISNGEEITLTEKSDDKSTELKKMKEGLWYQVKYDANGNVIAVGKASDELKGYKRIISFANVEEAVNAQDTVLLERGKVTKKLSLKGSTLFDPDYSATRGLAVDEDVKVVLVQTNDNDEEVYYYDGVSELESALKNLNTDKNGVKYNFSAIIESGLATIVVIDDQIDDKGDSTGIPGTTTGDVAKVELKVEKSKGMITLYDKNGKKIDEQNEYSFELWQYAQGQDNYVLVDEGTYTYNVTPAFDTDDGNSYYVVVDGVKSNIARA